MLDILVDHLKMCLLIILKIFVYQFHPRDLKRPRLRVKEFIHKICIFQLVFHELNRFIL